jgi:phosphoglycolate phosphatase-like HAD superfamily hydrolase
MPGIAALWGYREAHEDPQAWPATAWIAAPAELLPHLGNASA